MLMAPPPTTKEEYLTRFAQTWKVLRVGRFPHDEAKDLERAERTFERGLNPNGVGRQLRAILASGSRKERLRARQGADAGDSRHRRSAGASRGRQGHRGLDPGREAADDRGHGPRAADPDVAADHRRDRQARPWGGRRRRRKVGRCSGALRKCFRHDRISRLRSIYVNGLLAIFFVFVLPGLVLVRALRYPEFAAALARRVPEQRDREPCCW